MKKNVCFGTWMFALLLVTASAYATDMRPLSCEGGQKTKVEVPSKISGQAFDVRCDSSVPGQITFIYNLPGSKRGLSVSIVKTKLMKSASMVNIFAELTIESTVVNAKKTNITKLPQPNAVGKKSNNILVSVFASDNSIVEIHDERPDSSEETLVAFSSAFAQQLGPIISSWKR